MVIPTRVCNNISDPAGSLKIWPCNFSHEESNLCLFPLNLMSLMTTSPNREWLISHYLASASGTKRAMWPLPWALASALCWEPWASLWEVWLLWGFPTVKKLSHTERSRVDALVGSPSLWVISCPVTNLWMKPSGTLQTSSSASWEPLSDLSQSYREQKCHWDEHFQKFLTHTICEIKWLVFSV